MDTLRGRLDHATAKDYILAGHALITVRNPETGGRFTFKVSAPKPDEGQPVAPIRFVAVLSGSNNEEDYTYLGTLRPGDAYRHGLRSRVSADAPAVKAFAWTWRRLCAGTLPATIEVWHEGRCGRCGRLLTVPESVESGYGPECRARLGLAA